MCNGVYLYELIKYIMYILIVPIIVQTSTENPYYKAFQNNDDFIF